MVTCAYSALVMVENIDYCEVHSTFIEQTIQVLQRLLRVRIGNSPYAFFTTEALPITELTKQHRPIKPSPYRTIFSKQKSVLLKYTLH